MNPNITENTLLDYPRLARLRTYVAAAANKPAAMAEVGVYKGGSAYLIAETMNACGCLFGLHLFDTFEGMPATREIDEHKLGDFADTSLEAVQALLAPFSNVSFNKGVFPAGMNTINTARFSLVHLDCDIYESVRDGLLHFAPAMVPGGFIILDDVYAEDCPGALQAAVEFIDQWGMTLTEQVGPSAILKF